MVFLEGIGGHQHVSVSIGSRDKPIGDSCKKIKIGGERPMKNISYEPSKHLGTSYD